MGEFVDESQRLHLKCGHAFCSGCVGRLCSRQQIQHCPLCRSAFRCSRVHQRLNQLTRRMTELDEGLRQAAGIPMPFGCAVAGKLVTSGRKRTSKWVPVDNKEEVFETDYLGTVLASGVLTGGLGWTVDLVDGSKYVNNPPFFAYKPSVEAGLSEFADLREYGLVRADDPQAVENSILD